MKKLKGKIEGAMIRGKLGWKNFIRKENGDTNFISIAVILIIVIAFAVVFIAFKEEILPTFKQQKETLVQKLK